MEKTLNLVKMKGLLGPEVMANFEPVIVIKQESNENLASFYDVEDLMESPSNPTDFISHVEPEVHSNSGIGNLVSVNNVPYERPKNNFGKFTQVECNMDTSVSVTHSEQVNQVVCNSAWYPNLEFQLDCDLDPIYDELMNSKVAKSSVDYESVKLQFLSEPSDVNKIIHEDLVKQEPLEICFPNSETNKVDYCAVKGSDVENVRTEISDCCLTEVSKTCYVGKGRPSKTNCLTIKVNTRRNLSRDRLYSQVSDFEKREAIQTLLTNIY
ncbi:uncharacterized protein LOC143254326 [Tachypleus tridentatus]|uniref:uncharacterized protein LOC143254326 n=1 Tax=Tachypleus tridentatus TaxID=6853 RepID=UPI003FCF86D4